MARLHLDLVCRSHAVGTDAIRDHTLLLQHAVGLLPEYTANVHDLRHVRDQRELSHVITAVPVDVRHVVLLQYNPYSFADRGIPWWLPRAVERLRRVRPRAQIAVLVHELWVPLDSARHMLVGLAQRLLFYRLSASANLVAVSRDRLVVPAARLRRRSVGVLPSGSNLPDRRWARDTTRRALGIREDQPVLAAFGMTHPSRLLQHLRCAVLAAAEKNPETVVLNLGASTPSLDVGRSVRSVLTPGPLTADELARYLGAADLLLLPFSDGITTGRTTLMAGLQHGIPVLGTDGPSTSDDLRSSGAIALVQSATTPGTYARRACELLADARERGRLSRAGRALYEKRFAWPKIAAQLMAMIEEASTCDR